jgi:methyl-accepting chemotaxis protein
MTKNKLIATFAWLQLFISIALAATVIWGYTTYRASLGQFTQSVAASIVAVSNVVGRTAETIEAKQSLLGQASKTLFATRNLVKELQVTAENQARIAPQYAEGVRAASDTVGKLSVTFQSIGDGMMFTAPTGIEWHGMKPIVVKSRPLEKPAQSLKAHAQNFKAVSESLLGVSATIGRDGKNLSLAFRATSEQALKLLEETEKTLGRLKSNDLPKALVDLRETSENLRNVSNQVSVVGNVSEVFLIVGLLLAGWCFFNSLGLMLLNSKSVGSSSQIIERKS